MTCTYREQTYSSRFLFCLFFSGYICHETPENSWPGVGFFSLFIDSFVDEMRLTAVVYLLTFYGLSHAVPAGMTAVNEPSVEGISWTSWEQTKNNSDVILDTVSIYIYALAHKTRIKKSSLFRLDQAPQCSQDCVPKFAS